MQNWQCLRAAWLISGLALFGTACTKTKTTPPGSLGTFAVAPPLGIKQPASPPVSEQQSFETTLAVCETGRAKLVWYAFKSGPDAFVASYSVELLESSPDYEVSVVAAAGSDCAVGTTAAFVRQVNVGVRCDRESIWETRTKTAYVAFDGLGAVHDSAERQ
jgi:hypothetical protein